LSSSGRPRPRALPALTSAQVREVDRLAAERFRIPVEWLMEAAGWQLARHCRGRTAVVCGKGNNGGDGLAAARHLHRWGRLHSVACADAEALAGPAAREVDALRALGVEIETEPRFDGAQVVLDAIFGTGLRRPPEGRYAEWIAAINASGKRVIAVDVPSGLDADTGDAFEPTVSATVTVTLGLPKAGLLTAAGPAQAGEVWVADIGVPFDCYSLLGIQVPDHLFAMHDRLQLGALRL
jgi:hydroxyethylthiazole kinase-like uncharacterized protein yjeF